MGSQIETSLQEIRAFMNKYIASDVVSTSLIMIAIIFVTLFLSFFVRIALLKLEKRLSHSSIIWHQVIVKAMIPPIKYTIWLIGLSIVVNILSIENGSIYIKIIENIKVIGFSFITTWFVFRLIDLSYAKYIHKRSTHGETVDATTLGALIKLVKVVIVITILLIVLDNIGVEITGLVAIGGVSTAALGFAAKDLLSNFFGTIVIYLDKPFKVGDWITLPGKDIDGTVEEISWRMTKIRTFSRIPLYAPNSVFSLAPILNNTRMYNRRIKKTIGVRYQDVNSVAKISSQIKKMLQDHVEIDQKQIIIVNLVEFSESSVDILVYSFTKTTEWLKFQEIQEDVMLLINKIIEKNGAEIAFPTTTLDIPNQVLVKSK